MDAYNRLADFATVEPAPAKINLALHVVGQREDGYHLLDSLVTFAGFGDRLGLSDAREDRFTLSGRFAAALPSDPKSGENLVIVARDRLRAALTRKGRATPPVHIHLEKNLPVASGIGGGSADAAAALRGLMRLWRADLPKAELEEIALSLGADVPMCLENGPLVARGIGEEITRLSLPALAMVLANPLVGVSTPAVFRALATKTNPPLALPAASTDGEGWLRALFCLRNDLEAPARALCPQIGMVAESLSRSGAALVRMSGSGATCFGLYLSDAAARDAAADLSTRHPDWFVAATKTMNGAGHGAH